MSAARASLRGTIGQVQLARPRQLRVLGRHGGGHHDRAGPLDVRRIVARMDRDPEGGQVRGTGGIGIAAGDRNPRRQAMSAKALIPAPPMPTKWTGRGSAGLNRFMVDELM